MISFYGTTTHCICHYSIKLLFCSYRVDWMNGMALSWPTATMSRYPKSSVPSHHQPRAFSSHCHFQTKIVDIKRNEHHVGPMCGRKLRQTCPVRPQVATQVSSASSSIDTSRSYEGGKVTKVCCGHDSLHAAWDMRLLPQRLVYAAGCS